MLDTIAELEGAGETGLPDALHQAAERVRQRALIVIISDLFIEPEELKSCFQHLLFRKHDAVAFHLLDQNEVDFEFNRPMRFLDMEGGSSLLADPSVIAHQYRQAMQTYLTDLLSVIRDSAVDYHRVNIHEPYEQVLSRFLLGRANER